MASLTIMDNSVLDSSMDSTQGLLSFMTNASRQIKTYLGPDSNTKTQKKQRRQQILLQHLTQLNFIPDILKTSEYIAELAPASPTPSLDSVGSMDDDDTHNRSSCLLNSRRKRSHGSSNENQAKRARTQSNEYNNNNYLFSMDYDLNKLIPSINTTTTFQPSFESTTLDFNNNDTTYDTIIPSPSPDFDDLVDCMLTEDSLSKIDVNNYFLAL